MTQQGQTMANTMFNDEATRSNRSETKSRRVRYHHGQDMVAARGSCHGRGDLFSPRLRGFPSAAVRFSMVLRVSLPFCCYKSLFILSHGRYSLPFSSTQNSLGVDQREFEGEEEDLQSDGGSSKNRKIKRSHLSTSFSSLLFSFLMFRFIFVIYFRIVDLILELC